MTMLDGERPNRQHVCRYNLPFAPVAADRPGSSGASGHPARRVRAWPWLAAGFLARGSSPSTTFPGSIDPSGIYGCRLVAYSCGGSRGIARC